MASVAGDIFELAISSMELVLWKNPKWYV